MKERVLKTLERKQRQYREIAEWFESEWPSISSSSTLVEWEKRATECNAQIQILLYLLSEDTNF